MKYTTIKEYLDESFENCINGRLDNEEDFLEDYIRYQIETEIYNILQIYQTPSDLEQLVDRLNVFLTRTPLS